MTSLRVFVLSKSHVLRFVEKLFFVSNYRRTIMGKRKRSASRDSDYDGILRKMRRLERKIKKRQRQRSLSVSSEDSRPDYTGGGHLEETLYDEVITIDNNECSPTQLETTEPADTDDPSEPAAPAASADVQDDATEAPLEPEVLQLLGEDLVNQKSFGDNLHKDIAPRWTHILVNGLSKDNQSELLKRYLPPENCPNLRAPKLNLEIKAALPDINVKKDLYNQGKQNQLASSLAAIGQVLNWALASKSTVPQDIIKTLSDAGRLICDSHYRESQARRYAALNILNKNIRDTVKNTKIDEHLFGSDLSEHIKSSKAITRTGSELKQAPRTPYKAPPAPQVQRGALNSRGASRAAAAEPRTNPAARRPPRDRRQDSARGRRPNTAHTRQQARGRQ
ncbi:uncharacterized protein LOC126367168 [Pectinophora gossypiella]|uniref:uncharacterized protein LOC126367168 n=1 Tax=Pectinophora gossypiella TaxID=13191 RepID=UPI00214EAE02|nr:uncharacterized protein LOC126367168 [Pectinophora gossypiella]